MAYSFLHRSGEAARSSIVPDRFRSSRVFLAAEVERGWLVVDTDGVSVGKVAGLEGDFLTVGRGFLNPRLYVPLIGVREVTDGMVRLTLTIDQIRGSRWTEKPRQDH